MNNLKLNKFHQVAESPIFIRKERLSGKNVVFGLPGDLLSVLQEEIDFDAESELVLDTIKDTDRDRFFEYTENQFLEVNSPRWFKI